jgi:predicted amidohydrolase YtcJ
MLLLSVNGKAARAAGIAQHASGIAAKQPAWVVGRSWEMQKWQKQQKSSSADNNTHTCAAEMCNGAVKLLNAACKEVCVAVLLLS